MHTNPREKSEGLPKGKEEKEKVENTHPPTWLPKKFTLTSKEKENPWEKARTRVSAKVPVQANVQILQGQMEKS